MQNQTTKTVLVPIEIQVAGRKCKTCGEGCEYLVELYHNDTGFLCCLPGSTKEEYITRDPYPKNKPRTQRCLKLTGDIDKLGESE